MSWLYYSFEARTVEVIIIIIILIVSRQVRPNQKESKNFVFEIFSPSKKSSIKIFVVITVLCC